MRERMPKLEREEVFSRVSAEVEEGEMSELLDNAAEDVQGVVEEWVGKAKKEAQHTGVAEHKWRALFFSPEYAARIAKDVADARDQYCENQELNEEQVRRVKMVYAIAFLAARAATRHELDVTRQEYEYKELTDSLRKMALEDAHWQHELLGFIGRYHNDPLLQEGMESVWNSSYAIFTHYFKNDVEMRKVKNGVLGTITAATLLESVGISANQSSDEADVDYKVDLVGTIPRIKDKPIHLLLQIKTSMDTREPRLIYIDDKTYELEDKERNAAEILSRTASRYEKEQRESVLAYWVEMPSPMATRSATGDAEDWGINPATGIPTAEYIGQYRDYMVTFLNDARARAREKERNYARR